MRPIRAYAPASIGNFAAGFDMLGAALAPLDGSLLGDVVELRPAQPGEATLCITGPFADQLPGPLEKNLVLRSAELFRNAVGAAPAVSWAFTLEKNLPVNSGLGSSASSIVAALVALQAAEGEPLGWSELLELAGRAEGFYSGGVHLDNVGPSLGGGLQLIVPGRKEDQVHTTRSLPWFEDLVVVVIHPDCELPTAKARAVLPASVPMAQTVAWGQNLGAFVHALHARDRGLFAVCLRDLLVEPHRAGLVPGFVQAKAAALREGAFGCSLSGSGPSTFAVVSDETRATVVRDVMQSAFRAAGLDSQGWICGLDALGARVL
jgi:homoserine kinase